MSEGGALRTLRSLLPPILAAMAFGDAGVMIVHALVPDGALASSHDVVATYLQTLGTIYAVLLAFVVFVVWQQFNEAKAHVEREANELIDLHRLARTLPPAIRKPLLARARAYVDGVLGAEWMAMARGGGTAAFEPLWDELDALWEDFRKWEPVSDCEHSHYGEILARFNSLSDARTERLSAACARIPRALKILIYSGGVVVVASLYLFTAPLGLHLLMTAMMAGAVAHVLYLIHDLDDCFSGDWKVPREAFERVRRQMAKE